MVERNNSSSSSKKTMMAKNGWRSDRSTQSAHLHNRKAAHLHRKYTCTGHWAAEALASPLGERCLRRWRDRDRSALRPWRRPLPPLLLLLLLLLICVRSPDLPSQQC